MAAIDLSSLDVLVFLIYVALFCSIGIYFSRRTTSQAADYFLAGRSLPWYVVGSSYIAANISTEHFIGLVAVSYTHLTLPTSDLV